MIRIKNIALFSLALISAACISPPLSRVPGSEVMHYPFAMAFENNTLMVSSQASDGEYDFGRLLAINNGKISANMLVPTDTGPMVLTANFLVFASRADDHVYAVQRNGATLHCNDPAKSLSECQNASSLKLSGREPYSLAAFNNGNNIIASFQGSDGLELLSLDRGGFTKQKLVAAEALFKIKGVDLKKNRLVTRKIFITEPNNNAAAKVYVLMEKYAKKISDNINCKGAVLLSFLASNLVNEAQMAANQLEILDLKEKFGINSAQDMLVINDEILLLAKVPQTLYKINMTNEDKFMTQPMCSGAASLNADVDKDRLFISCFNDNKVISIIISSFQRNADSGYLGRGPAMLALDAATPRVFVSLNTEGTVAILNYESLKPQSYLFKKAAKNRTGS